MTSNKSVAAVATELYNLLEALEPEDQQRSIAAALALLGIPGTVQGWKATSSGNISGAIDPAGTAAALFAQKEPNSKLEELAVAARYREIQGADTHTRDELQEVFKIARRNFDGHNFRRDIDNAKKKGLFTRGAGLTLAYYGQQYVDALPDRDAISALKSPKRA